MDYVEFIDWLRTSAGIGVALGFILSFVIESWWPKWETLLPRVKRLVVFALCMIIPVLITLLGSVTNVLSGSFADLWFPALVAGFSAFSATTVSHIRKL